MKENRVKSNKKVDFCYVTSGGEVKVSVTLRYKGG